MRGQAARGARCATSRTASASPTASSRFRTRACCASDPLRLLDVFAVAQQHDVPLTRKARRLVRENLDLIDDGLPRQSRGRRRSSCASSRAERRVMRSLIAMNEVGLLARFLPEWEHIVCRWQHVMYHTYTVDVHSIFLVEELRRLWQGRVRSRQLPELTELMRDVRRPRRALPRLPAPRHRQGLRRRPLAEGRGARARAASSGSGSPRSGSSAWSSWCEHHLLMSHLAQSRDLSDPKLILEFARAGAGPHAAARSLPAHLRRHPRLLEAGLDRLEGPAAARALRADLGVPRDGRRRPAARALELIERARRDAAPGGRRPSCNRSASPSPRCATTSTRCRGATSSRTRRAQIARHALVVIALRPQEPRDVDGGARDPRRLHRVHPLHARRARAVRERGRACSRRTASTSWAPTSTRRAPAWRSRSTGSPRRRAATRSGACCGASCERALTRVLSGEQRVADLLRRRGRARCGPDRRPRASPRRVVVVERRVGLLHDRRRHGERPAGPAARSDAHDRGPRLRDLHLEGGDGARPGDRHLLPEGRARARSSPTPSAIERLRARPARGGGAGRGRAWRRLGARSSPPRSTPSSRRAAVERGPLAAHDRGLRARSRALRGASSSARACERAAAARASTWPASRARSSATGSRRAQPRARAGGGAPLPAPRRRRGAAAQRSLAGRADSRASSGRCRACCAATRPRR